MAISSQAAYHKRYQMVRHFRGPVEVPPLPPGYESRAWSPALIDAHAAVKHASFAGTLDAGIFPSLGSAQGCRVLMAGLARRPAFLPCATWLVEGPDGPCATVQGVRDRFSLGAVQNLGVVPAERGNGLGTWLLLRAMAGFQRWGLAGVMLEVTARNTGAIRLYRRLGFACAKSVYKRVEVGDASP